jgi:hypothetical protein
MIGRRAWQRQRAERLLSVVRSHCLGFAVLLKFFQYTARFPFSMQEVPTTAVAYVAGQVGVPAEEFSRYDWEGRAVKYHRAMDGIYHSGKAVRDKRSQDRTGI